MFYLIVALKENVYPPLEVSDYTGEMELCTRASDVTRPMINTIQSLQTSGAARKTSNFGPLFNFGSFTSILQGFTFHWSCFFSLEDYRQLKMSILYVCVIAAKGFLNFFSCEQIYVDIVSSLKQSFRSRRPSSRSLLVAAFIHWVTLFCHCLCSQLPCTERESDAVCIVCRSYQ